MCDEANYGHPDNEAQVEHWSKAERSDRGLTTLKHTWTDRSRPEVSTGVIYVEP